MKLFAPALAAALILPALGTAMPTAFSCDMVVEGAIAGHTTVSKLYVSGPKVRLESERSITILRKDRGVAWALFKQSKAYVEMPVGNPAVDPTRDPLAGASKQILGKEMMNGYLCTKMRLTKNDPKLGSINAIVWNADTIGMPVRTETNFRGNRIVENRKNIQMSAPLESLFEVPAGYAKLVPRGKVGAGSAGGARPSWLAPYPGTQMRCAPGSGSSGSCDFNTRDSVERVVDFYQRSLPSHGFTVKRSAIRGRVPMVSLSATGHGVHWNATIGVNASGQTAVQFNWLPGR